MVANKHSKDYKFWLLRINAFRDCLENLVTVWECDNNQIITFYLCFRIPKVTYNSILLWGRIKKSTTELAISMQCDKWCHIAGTPKGSRKETRKKNIFFYRVGKKGTKLFIVLTSQWFSVVYDLRVFQITHHQFYLPFFSVSHRRYEYLCHYSPTHLVIYMWCAIIIVCLLNFFSPCFGKGRIWN